MGTCDTVRENLIRRENYGLYDNDDDDETDGSEGKRANTEKAPKKCLSRCQWLCSFAFITSLAIQQSKGVNAFAPALAQSSL